VQDFLFLVNIVLVADIKQQVDPPSLLGIHVANDVAPYLLDGNDHPVVVEQTSF
jgi:hypothetical protein